MGVIVGRTDLFDRPAFRFDGFDIDVKDLYSQKTLH